MKKQEKPKQPNGKPVYPKKPLPAQEESAKIPVPRGFTEERVREIAREEIWRVLSPSFAKQSNLEVK